MGLTPVKNTRQQVRQNSQSLQRISDRFNPVFQRISEAAQSSKDSANSPGVVSRAACTQDAQGTAIITATLYASDGTTGEAISVYCNISNGTALNEAVPRLEIGDDISVTKSFLLGTGLIWYCVSNFQASEDCTCEQTDAVFNSVTIASDEKLTLSGVGGDTFIRHNSVDGEVEHDVEGTEVVTW